MSTGVFIQYVPTNNSAGGVNPKSSMAEYLEVDPEIGSDSAYDGGYLSHMGYLFIGGTVTSQSKSPTSDDVDVGAPDFFSYDLFFICELCSKLEADAFYDAVENLHKTGTLAIDTKVTPPGDEPLPSNHPVKQYSDSYESEYEPDPPNNASTGNYRQCGAYRWFKRDFINCNGVYEPGDQYDVSKDSVKEDPEYLGL